jgi:hypothetical protein
MNINMFDYYIKNIKDIKKINELDNITNEKNDNLDHEYAKLYVKSNLEDPEIKKMIKLQKINIIFNQTRPDLTITFLNYEKSLNRIHYYYEFSKNNMTDDKIFLDLDDLNHYGFKNIVKIMDTDYVIYENTFKFKNFFDSIHLIIINYLNIFKVIDDLRKKYY